MTAREQIIVTDRFRRALLAMQSAGWIEPRQRVRRDIHTAAMELIDAYEAFTAAGLVAGTADRQLVFQAQQYLANGRHYPPR